MKRRLIILSTSLVLAFSMQAHPIESVDYDPIEITDEWTALISQDGIEVEYKVQECNNQKQPKGVYSTVRRLFCWFYNINPFSS